MFMLKATCFLQCFDEVHGVSKVRWASVEAKQVKPCAPWLRVNVDAAMSCSSRAHNCIARNQDAGRGFVGAECLVGSFSTVIYEALAILFVVNEAIARNFQRVEIKNDCQRGANLPLILSVSSFEWIGWNCTIKGICTVGNSIFRCNDLNIGQTVVCALINCYTL